MRQGELLDAAHKLVAASHCVVALATELVCASVLSEAQAQLLLFASWPRFPDVLALCGTAAALARPEAAPPAVDAGPAAAAAATGADAAAAGAATQG